MPVVKRRLLRIDNDAKSKSERPSSLTDVHSNRTKPAKICEKALIVSRFYFLLTSNTLVTVFNTLKQPVKLWIDKNDAQFKLYF